VAFVVSGFLVGVIIGLTGVGGGSLMTPLLVLGFGIQPASAVGTDLIYAAVTKTLGASVHGFNRNIDWRITGLLAAGSVPAGGLTVWAIATHGRADPHVSSLITLALGVALVLTALATFGKSYVQAYAMRLSHGRDDVFSPWLTVVAGAVLGVLVSMTSVGAGALGITALLFLYPKIPTARLIGSDIAHSVPLAFVAGFGHWLIGSVQVDLLGVLLLGSIPGILIGSWLSPRMPDFWLRMALAIVLLIVGGRLVIG
jgi:uncharacterized membrane protein YfcA